MGAKETGLAPHEYTKSSLCSLAPAKFIENRIGRLVNRNWRRQIKMQNYRDKLLI